MSTHFITAAQVFLVSINLYSFNNVRYFAGCRSIEKCKARLTIRQSITPEIASTKHQWLLGLVVLLVTQVRFLYLYTLP